MAHSLSAKKRIRQNVKRRAQNRARKSAVREQVKAFSSALGSGDAAKADLELRKVVKKLDQVAAKGTIHRNTAARRRSRLQKKLNALANKGSGKAPASA